MADVLFNTRAYVYTFVNQFGEEGPPSPASREITTGSNAGVVLSLAHAPVAAKYGIVAKRLYRTSFGDDQSEFRLVAELPLETVTYADTKRDDELGETLQSLDWDPPPANLTGIVSLAGGMLAGFIPDTGVVCVSHPYQAHAWPVRYRLRFDYPIVGLMPLDSGFVVFAGSETYWIGGTAPDQFAPPRRCVSAPWCIGRRSIVSEGPVGYYASAAGPVKTDGQSFAYLLEATNSATEPARLYAGHVNETVASDTGNWGFGNAEDLRRDAPTLAVVSDDRLYHAFFYDGTPLTGVPTSAWTFVMYEFDLRSRSYPFLCGVWSWLTDQSAGEEFISGHPWFDKLTRTFYTLRGTFPANDLSLARLFPRGASSGLPADAQWVSKEFSMARPFHPGVMYVDFSYLGGTLLEFSATGDGVTTTYVLGTLDVWSSGVALGYDVFIDGVRQRPLDDYTLDISSPDRVLVLAAPVPEGSELRVMQRGTYDVGTEYEGTGDGSTVTFTLGDTASWTSSDPAAHEVHVDGVRQWPTTDYGLGTSGSDRTITFTTAPPAGSTVWVAYRGFTGTALQYLHTPANGVQRNFTLGLTSSWKATEALLYDVFVDGVRQHAPVDYTVLQSGVYRVLAFATPPPGGSTVFVLLYGSEGVLGGALLPKVRVEVVALHGEAESVVADESFVLSPTPSNVVAPHSWVRRCRVLAGPRSHRVKLRVTLPSGYPTVVRRVVVAENMDEVASSLQAV